MRRVVTGVIGVSSRAPSPIEYHERLAPEWEGRYRRGGFRRRAAFFEKEIRPLLSLGGDWIDVGCGSGFYARRLALGGARVLGIDGAAAMIEAARAASETVRWSADRALTAPRYEVRRIEAMDYPEASFDGAMALSVLEYLDDPAACLSQMARMVKPGGQVVISAPNSGSFVRALQTGLRWLAPARGALEYLDTSTHRWDAKDLPEQASSVEMRLQFVAQFDPVLPSWLHGLLAPSMLYFILRKPSAAPS